MRKALTLFTLLLLAAKGVMAQQDPMFTKYMFNSLIFNPGYAGSNEHLTMNLLHRSQWVGIEGAPTTQTLTLHTPMRNDNVGIGGSLVYDQIGPTTSIAANFAYAYRLPVGEKAKLAIGLQGGVYNWRTDWTKLRQYDPSDPAYAENLNLIKPNIGAGIYYYTRHFYAGIGVPHIIEWDLTGTNRTDATDFYAKQYRHYFLSVGGAVPLAGKNLIFKPSLLVKAAAPDSRFNTQEGFKQVGAPTEFNVDLSLLFNETLWLGTSFRSAIEAFGAKKTSSYDSADLWAAIYMPNGMRVGAGYDFTLTKLRSSTSGSFEIMLGYEFDYKTKKVVTPRYF